MYRYGDYPRSMTVAERRSKAHRALARLRTTDPGVEPVVLGGARNITRTVWGTAWCDHLESLSDIASRLGRGRSYVRHDCVVDLRIGPGKVTATVSGTELYQVQLQVQALQAHRWDQLVSRCAGAVGSVLDLLSGTLSPAVMDVLCDRVEGLFPHSRELSSTCTCPDYARVCKHVAAVYYGIGARLDRSPELLFRLRQVSPDALIQATDPLVASVEPTLDGDDLSDLFGIDLDIDFGPDPALLSPALVPPAHRDASSAGVPVPSPPQARQVDPTQRGTPGAGDLLHSLLAALIGALLGAHDIPEAQGVHDRSPRLLPPRSFPAAASLGALERWLGHTAPDHVLDLLTRFVDDVLVTAPPLQSFPRRLQAANANPQAVYSKVHLQPQANGGIVLHGVGWVDLVQSLDPATTPTLAICSASDPSPVPLLQARGIPWAVDLTTAHSALSRELYQFFADADTLDYDDVPHHLFRQSMRTMRWVDWVDWLPSNHPWTGVLGVGRRWDAAARSPPTTWLGALTPTQAERLVQHPLPAPGLTLPPRSFDPTQVFAPFVAAAETLLHHHGLTTPASRKRWQAAKGWSVQALKEVFRPS